MMKVYVAFLKQSRCSFTRFERIGFVSCFSEEVMPDPLTIGALAATALATAGDAALKGALGIDLNALYQEAASNAFTAAELDIQR